MDLDYLAARIKELEEFELLATTEIKAWLCRIISSRECNDTVKQAMDDAVVTLADLNSKMPAYWKDSAGEQDVRQVIHNLQSIRKYIS
jgi:hypothetical protein